MAIKRKSRREVGCVKEILHEWRDYVKLQQAYISETNDYAGSWALIGYKGPGEQTAATSGEDATSAQSATSNFTYKDGFSDKTELGTAALGWSASNKAVLNDCPKGENWTITVAKNSSSSAGGEAVFFSAIAEQNKALCEPLTPSFDAIGGGTAATPTLSN